VITQSSAYFAFLADQTSVSLTFTGNDAVGLYANGNLVDLIGQIGNYPGLEWGTGNTSTADNTLRRKPEVHMGRTDGGEFDPMVEWLGFGTDDSSGLGYHFVEPISDFNESGVVDAADYVVWRKNQGTTNLLPNDLVGGTIGTAQYNQWRAHFGQTAGSGASAIANASVPEPATWVLAMLGSAAGIWIRRRANTRFPST